MADQLTPAALSYKWPAAYDNLQSISPIMCQTEAIGRDLSLMKRLSEETGSLPLCRCRISPVLMSLQTPGTTYHTRTASPHPILLLRNLLQFFFIFIFVSSAPSCSLKKIHVLVSLSLLFLICLNCYVFEKYL